MLSLIALDVALDSYQKRIDNVPDLTDEQYLKALGERASKLCTMCISVRVRPEEIPLNIDVDKLTDKVLTMQRRVEAALNEIEKEREQNAI